MKYRTQDAEELFQNILPSLHRCLDLTDRLDWSGATSEINAARAVLDSRDRKEADDALKDDLYVLTAQVEIFRQYSAYWQAVHDGRFGESWGILQDVLDGLATVKRFSGIDVERLVQQMLALETGYPYKIFASIGVKVARWECSICGESMDSFNCPHRRNELYAGERAYAIARDGLELDHVSLVENPVDRRCIVQLEGHPTRFPVIEYLREKLVAGEMRPLSVADLDHTPKTKPNPKVGTQGRNDPCSCGSGEKFKKCCGRNSVVEVPHVTVVGDDRGPRDYLDGESI